MRIGFISILIGASATLAAPACNAGRESGTAGAGAVDASSSSGFLGSTTGAGTGGAGPTCTPGGPNADVDQDGFTPAEGDCDDCDPARNPDAIEVATPPGKEAFDEDCDGLVDEDDTTTCDDALALESDDPGDAAKAIELCKASTGPKDWGLVSAKWVLADGADPPTDPALRHAYDVGHGMLATFGPNVAARKGQHMLGLSSGSARQPSDPGYLAPSSAIKGFPSGQPAGFPKESPACPGTVTGDPFDAAAVELEILAPSNATGISFDFDFYTYEWPDFVCSTFNDFFVALLSPTPPGQSDGNISFDGLGNPISVNNALLDACGCPGNPPGTCDAGGKTFACGLGDETLIGTGFGFDTEGSDHGSTGWLRTIAPVEGGKTFTLRFAVYDSGDGKLASTTLIDDFQWIATPGTKVVTKPAPQ